MHERRIDIRWRDLDALGHVNQAVYQTYGEEILDSFFRQALDLGEGEIWDYVAARVAIDYRGELRLNDGQVVGTCRVDRVGTSSVTLKIEMRTPGGRLAAECEIVVVTWDPEARASRPLTDAERVALSPAHG